MKPVKISFDLLKEYCSAAEQYNGYNIFTNDQKMNSIRKAIAWAECCHMCENTKDTAAWHPFESIRVSYYVSDSPPLWPTPVLPPRGRFSPPRQWEECVSSHHVHHLPVTLPYAPAAGLLITSVCDSHIAKVVRKGGWRRELRGRMGVGVISR